MIDHMLFDKHKYISDVQILNGFIDTKLIGKTITRSNYKVYWANVAGGVAGGSEMDFGVDDSSLSTEIPDDVDTYSITSTGEIYSLKLSEQQTPYFWLIFMKPLIMVLVMEFTFLLSKHQML